MAAALLFACIGSAHAQNGLQTGGREPIIGLPCEGCEAVFEGLPDTFDSTARIAPLDQPGEPLRIEGTVYDGSGRPAPGVIVYAYHTDARGIYPRDERLRGSAAYRHGKLRAWVKTDDRGRYRFDTIRPASYPNRENPAHVHMHVIEPGCCTYYITSIHFEDDPLLSEEERDRVVTGRGGSGLVQLERDESAVWVARRDIVLGKGVPEYPEGEAGRTR
jgi:protocatechuate 3,4-dioxygenase beta subunit